MNMRKEIGKTQKELGRGLQILTEKKRKQREREGEGERMRELEAIRLREQRIDLGKDIDLGRAEISSRKAPPPPAPKTKAPPTKLIESPPKSPTKSSQLSQEDESGCSSGEEEERGNIAAGPIDLTKPEQVTWPHNLAKLAIAELKD